METTGSVPPNEPAYLARLREMTQSLPADLRVGWISTRKLKPAADALAQYVTHSYLLHHVLKDCNASLTELGNCDLVVIEAPPTMLAGFETDLNRVVSKIKASGPEVAVVCQPGSRKSHQQALWIQKWNRLVNKPFVFHRTCACRQGAAVPDLHLTLYVGSTFPCSVNPCTAVPHVMTMGPNAQLSLGGAMLSLSAAVPSLRTRPLRQSPTVLPAAGTATGSCDTPPQTLFGALTGGPQRTPDSVVPLHSFEGIRQDKIDHSIPPPPPAYPTDAKEKERNRRNELKAKGITIQVKKRKFCVEDHHDDCGDCLSSLDAL